MEDRAVVLWASSLRCPHHKGYHSCPSVSLYRLAMSYEESSERGHNDRRMAVMRWQELQSSLHAVAWHLGLGEEMPHEASMCPVWVTCPLPRRVYKNLPGSDN